MTSAKNQSVLTRTLNQISSSTSNNLLSHSPVPNDDSATSTNPFDKHSEYRLNNIITVDDSGFTLLSNDAIMRILNIHSEAVIRCVELEDPQELYCRNSREEYTEY